MYKNYIKRILDFCIALCALSILWPILLVITIFLHFANKGAGAFFTQERPGKDAKIFKVVKYKTMTDERDAEGKLLPDAQRLTKIGKIVRSLSIDELPQLINVLFGQMNLIGYRPVLRNEKILNNLRTQYGVYQLKPGITGYAQVNGRDLLGDDPEKKSELDAYYLKNISPWLDIKILFKTSSAIANFSLGISEITTLAPMSRPVAKASLEE